MTSLSASWSTMRRSKQLHFDPGRMTVMVWSDSTTRPSNCTRRWCSKYPHSTRTKEIEMRRPSAYHLETDSLESLHQVQDQSYRSLPSFSCMVIESFHIQQGLPHSAFSSSTKPSVASHSTRYVSCHFAWTSSRRGNVNNLEAKMTGGFQE